jgi:CRP/FNR family cyclic AMP-dependent transcriptional regulator
MAREPALLLTEDPDNAAARFDLLGSLTAEEQQRVRHLGRRTLHANRSSVFRQGDIHNGIFLIEKGSVRTFYTGVSGREITLAYWTPGHFVGGPELFGGSPHIWSGVASGPTETLRLEGDHLRRLMNEMPALAICLVEGLVHKGRCYSELLQLLATQSVEERLVQLLQNLMQLYGIREGDRKVIGRYFSHEDLANMVGATRQWVTMTLSRLQKQGLIQIIGRRIYMSDVESATLGN